MHARRLALDVECDGGTRATLGPHLVIEVNHAGRLLAIDADDDIMATQPRPLGRSIRRDATDHHVAVDVLSVDADPRLARTGHAPICDQVAEDWRQEVDWNKHVARRVLALAGGIADNQRANANKLALLADQGCAAPGLMR